MGSESRVLLSLLCALDILFFRAVANYRRSDMPGNPSSADPRDGGGGCERERLNMGDRAELCSAITTRRAPPMALRMVVPETGAVGASALWGRG